MRFVDLHLHTVFSDGTYTPQELVAETEKAGLCCISVTDHDCVEAIAQVTEIGKSKNIEVIAGIELTAEYEGSEIHLLGYLIDHQNKELREKLKVLCQNRIERIYKITGKLKNIGIAINPQEIFDMAGEGTVGRLHVARALLKNGITSSIFEAFQKYIGDKGPAYVLGFRFSPEEAIRLIRDTGGIPVLAHPYSLHNDDLVVRLIKSGVMGLEVYYPEHSQGVVNFYLDLAKKYNLLLTGGSDCHGTAKPEVKVGSLKIPYELVDKLKEAKAKL